MLYYCDFQVECLQSLWRRTFSPTILIFVRNFLYKLTATMWRKKTALPVPFKKHKSLGVPVRDEIEKKQRKCIRFNYSAPLKFDLKITELFTMWWITY